MRVYSVFLDVNESVLIVNEAVLIVNEAVLIVNETVLNVNGTVLIVNEEWNTQYKHVSSLWIIITTIHRHSQNHMTFHLVPVSGRFFVNIMVSYSNFNPLEVVSRYRDPQLQVAENY